MDKETLAEFDDAIAAAVRSKMAEKLLDQQTVAAAAGIPATTFSRYYNGERAISASKLVAVADAMGVETGDIVKAAKQIISAAKQEPRI